MFETILMCHCATSKHELPPTHDSICTVLYRFIYDGDLWKPAGFRSRPSDGATAPDWVLEARALARKYLEEWRMPGTENIVVRSLNISE